MLLNLSELDCCGLSKLRELFCSNNVISPIEGLRKILLMAVIA